MVKSRNLFNFGLLFCVSAFFMFIIVKEVSGIESEWAEKIQTVIKQTKPLRYSRGDRLPIYLWPAMDAGRLEQADAEKLVKLLDERGIGLICSWNWRKPKESFAQGLPVARAQKKLGLMINIDATSCMYSFYDGKSGTSHIDSDNRPFLDNSFGSGSRMGCPFTLSARREVIRSRIAGFIERYKKERLGVDFIFADWEIDGPIESNRAWEFSKRCKRCRENIADIDNFLSFQKTVRQLRSDLQRDVYAEPVLRAFPKALVGNYGVYPHNGYRYWFDYFEKNMPYHPALTDQRAKYRHWYNEFELTDYTFAMPVVYTWQDTWNWYDFEVADYRWFYNMLLVGSNAGRYTPQAIPIITFVHWHTTAPPKKLDPKVKQFSEEKYQELLWHLLLRGHDTFFLWCGSKQNAKEVRLVHQVWSEAQQYGEFLEKGRAVVFDVPGQPGPVVSALRLGNKLLVRRTDFTDDENTVNIIVDGQSIEVSATGPKCRVITLK